MSRSYRIRNRPGIEDDGLPASSTGQTYTKSPQDAEAEMWDPNSVGQAWQQRPDFDRDDHSETADSDFVAYRGSVPHGVPYAKWNAGDPRPLGTSADVNTDTIETVGAPVMYEPTVDPRVPILVEMAKTAPLKFRREFRVNNHPLVSGSVSDQPNWIGILSERAERTRAWIKFVWTGAYLAQNSAPSELVNIAVPQPAAGGGWSYTLTEPLTLQAVTALLTTDATAGNRNLGLEVYTPGAAGPVWYALSNTVAASGSVLVEFGVGIALQATGATREQPIPPLALPTGTILNMPGYSTGTIGGGDQYSDIIISGLSQQNQVENARCYLVKRNGESIETGFAMNINDVFEVQTIEGMAVSLDPAFSSFSGLCEVCVFEEYEVPVPWVEVEH